MFYLQPADHLTKEQRERVEAARQVIKARWNLAYSFTFLIIYVMFTFFISYVYVFNYQYKGGIAYISLQKSNK